MQCYPQPSQRGKILNQIFIFRKITIKYRRKMNTDKNSESLQHTLFMNKRNYSRRYSLKVNKKELRELPSIYAQV